MIARDEEAFIGDALASARDLVDEIVVALDDRTTDQTYDVVHHWGGKVVDCPLRDDYAAFRNLAAAECTGDLLLVLDADERLTRAGQQTIADCLLHIPATVDGFCFTIEQRALDDRFLGISHSNPRLLLRQGYTWVGYAHEHPVPIDRAEDFRWGLCEGLPQILHYGNDPGLWSARDKSSRSIRLLKKWLLEHPRDAHSWAHLARELYEIHRYGEAKRAAGRAFAHSNIWSTELRLHLEQIRRC